MQKDPVVQQNQEVKAATPAEGRVTRMPSRRRWLVPAVNIYETPQEFVIEAEMPGVTRDELEVTVEGNQLTIVGRRTAETVEGRFLLRERGSGMEYRRVFELDPALDTNRVTARLEQGLLTLVLPKAQELQPRRIPVTD